MGSGVSGLYSGTHGSSQNYASKYSVVPSMKKRDEKQGIYSDEMGYKKNPTAINIQDAIVNKSVHIDGKRMDGKITYVIDKQGNMIIGLRDKSSIQRSPHPRLIGGRNPEVKCAGMITFRKGRIVSVDNDSGHYRPPKESMKWTYAALDKLPAYLFDKSFRRK